MKDVWLDIRRLFYYPQKGIVKIILANCLLFVLLIVLKVVAILSNHKEEFDHIYDWITLSNQYHNVYFKPWTFLSYAFVHVEIFHLLFNMLVLYWFGTILNDFIGEKKIVQLYILGALAGGIAYLLISNSISYFVLKGPALLNGASASIYAIVIAAATIRPNYKVSLFIFGSVSIKYIGLFYVIWSFIETTGSNAGGNIAHLGGALLGYLYGIKFKKNWVVHKKEPIKVRTYMGTFKNEFSFVNKQEEEDIEEEELNEILDKISKSGYDSLSKFEKKRLFKASQKNN